MRSVVEIGASVPAFLAKLWKLVNDSETDHLISWSPGGKTFCIYNQAQFARQLLPLYYKHNNMASFIRQLNMYDFHKITAIETGGLRFDKDEIEFCHPCFMKGHACLLDHIKRKITNPKAIISSNDNGDKMLVKPELMTKLLTDVKQMKGKQEIMDAKFSAMKQENEALWREIAILRQKHTKQQQIVNNLIQFLMSLVQTPRPANNNSSVGVKRPFQLMINNEAHNSDYDLLNHSSRSKQLKLDKNILQHLCEDIQEEGGTTIHELGHDDVSEDSPNPSPDNNIDPVDYVTVEIPMISSADTPGQQYEVTLADDSQARTYSQSNPIVSSPSPVNVTTPSPSQFKLETTALPTITLVPTTSKGKGKSNSKDKTVSKSRNIESSNFNIIPTTADLNLPADIFDNDEASTNCDDVSLSNVLQDNILINPSTPTTSTLDKMVGGFNLKIDKPAQSKSHSKKSKTSKGTADSVNVANIKTEVQDDDWSVLPVVNNNTNSRFNNMNRRDYYNKLQEDLSHYGGHKDDIDDHLDTMQTDLESLRDLLRGDSYSFDNNTLLGLFGNEDPMYGLSYNPFDDRSKSGNNAMKQIGEPLNLSRCENNAPDGEIETDTSNQLMSYTGNMPDLEDITIPDLEGEDSQDMCISPALMDTSSTLNTPQMVMKSPAFPRKP